MIKYLLALLFVIVGMTPTLSQSNEKYEFNFTGNLIDEKGRPFYGEHLVECQYKAINDKNKSRLPYQVRSFNGQISISIPLDQNIYEKIKLSQIFFELIVEIKVKNYNIFRKTYTNIRNGQNLGNFRLVKEKEIETPAPTDLITNDALLRTGQTSVGRALHYASPGLNSTSQPVSDGSSHYDPTDFRNLGSSRSLILINGKRKNFGSYIQVNDIPNKGEVGVDIRSIPLTAIEQVKVERQEASTLYGSDAVGGILDFQLKERHPKLSASVLSGINSEKWDGFTYGLDLTKGVEFGTKGFLTISYSYLNQLESNRANEPGYDSLQTFVTPYRATWIKRNPSLKMRIGEPNMTTNTVFYNLKVTLGEKQQNEFYSFGGVTYRNTISYANYRTPYWVREDYRIFSTSDSTYNGFGPTFEGDARDHFMVFGIIGNSEDGKVEYDISQTFSGNEVDFSVDSSFNPTLMGNSPISFKSGGYNLVNNNTRLDLTWTVMDWLKMRLGGDFRSERYNINAGEETSYTGEGTISYPGTQPKDAITANRNNFGGFAQLIIDNGDFNFEASYRYEKYYKFSKNDALKLAGFYRLFNQEQENLKWTARFSYSEGFRAPALQQLYYNRVQTVTTASGVSNRGTFSTYSPVLRQLGVNPLKNETSRTFSIGTDINWILFDKSTFSLEADFYNVDIDDRIVLSGNIDSARISNPNNEVRKILSQNRITSLNFFTNAINTRNAGVDINMLYNYPLSDQKKDFIEVSFASNIALKNKIRKIEDAPPKIATTGIDIFNRKEQARLLTARPSNKTIIGVRFVKEEKYDFMLNSIYFGRVSWQHQTDSLKDQSFSGKWVTNISAGVHVNEAIYISININNLLNVKPDILNAKGDPNTNGGGRYRYFREVNQFGYIGRSFLLRVTFSL